MTKNNTVVPLCQSEAIDDQGNRVNERVTTR